jgi:protease IV
MRSLICLVSLLMLGLLAGCGTPSFLVTPVPNVNVLREVVAEPGRGWVPPKVAIIEVEGMLINMRSGGFLQPTENKLSLFVQQLNAAAADPRVRAVVLRINSPGGTVTTSDAMHQAILDFRQRTGKVVIASTQDVCASGAYYVAAAADRIVVHPTSVVGSIGVVFNVFDMEGTLAMLGVRSESIKSGPYKDMGSPFQRMTEEHRSVMQGMVDEYFTRFVRVVEFNRPIPDEATLVRVTSGEVFTGERAVELGLADSTGRLEDALLLARSLAGVPHAAVVMYKRPHGYSGSIYASQSTPAPQSNVLRLDVGAGPLLPTGFYYLWQP